MDYFLLATDFPPQVGGIQTYHSNLARALQALGRKICVIATDTPTAAEYDPTAPYPIVRVPTAGGKPAIYRRMRDEALRLAGRNKGPLRGIVATKWSPEGPGALQAAERLGVPWGVFGHDREHILHAANGLKWALQTYLYRKASFCFAISNYAAANFRRGHAPAQRIHMVGCGINSENFQPDPQRAAQLRVHHGLEGQQVLLTLARLAPHKGHITVIKALSEVIRECGQVKYLIVGEGEARSKIEEAVATAGLHEHVLLTGRVPAEDLLGYYTLADLMVMPSFDIPGIPTEGFGLSFLEANCCGTVAVGSRTGGIPDAIEDGVSGLLVPPRNPKALAQAITQLLRNPERLAAMAQIAQKRAREQFQWRQVAERVDAAFSSWWDRKHS